MTYSELLDKHLARRNEIVKQFSSGMLNRFAKADINKFASFIALPFLEELSDNVSELMDSADDYEKQDIADLYMSFQDNNIDYDSLPWQVRIN